MNRKTLELLLVNYQNLHNSMAYWKPCAEKTKFITLIAEIEEKIKKLGKEIIYPDGMTALEYAKKLATEANKRYKIENE